MVVSAWADSGGVGPENRVGQNEPASCQGLLFGTGFVAGAVPGLKLKPGNPWSRGVWNWM